MTALQITTRTGDRPDYKLELFPLHSPLLGESLLVSFPPLIDMLKFSGYSYLISDQVEKNEKGPADPPRREGGIRSAKRSTPRSNYRAFLSCFPKFLI